MLPEESIPEILSLMTTVDYMKKTEHLWKDDADIVTQSETYNKIVENVFSFMTEEEKNKILELYRKATQSPASE